MEINAKITEQIEKIISEMTLLEKTRMIHGATLFKTGTVERLDIPAISTSDGPMGVRNEFKDAEWQPYGPDDDYVTYLPSNSAIASTWNRELAYKAGHTLSMEARGRGKDMILAPGINIKRDPLCGRNFEYMSEDPYVIEELAPEIVKGIQENDVSACVKHFALNNQETARMEVDTYVDELTLNEIYLKGFKACIEKGNTYAIMGAYNKFEGEYCCDNKKLLDDILRKQLGFEGVLVSDWGGVRSTVTSANTSMDIDMDVSPDFDNYYYGKPLIKAVENGEVSLETINEKIRRILTLMYKINMLGEDSLKRKSGEYNAYENRLSALDVAREAVILLKNENKLLPLDKTKVKNVLVIGSNAVVRHSHGGGSAEIKALYEIPLLMGLKMKLGGNVAVDYKEGYYVPNLSLSTVDNWQADSTNGKEMEFPYVTITKPLQFEKQNKELFSEALLAAEKADVVIFAGGLDHNYDIEGRDRDNMKLPYDQDLLLDKLLDVRKDTIVVMNAGSPVEMPWLEKCENLIWNYYSGCEYGVALADVIIGNVNPSGKLSESFPIKYEDTVTYKNGQMKKTEKVCYEEGMLYGYRYYDKSNIPVAFPFGYGLSYSEFEMENCSIALLDSAKNETIKYEKIIAGDSLETIDFDDEIIDITLSVKNKSNIGGKEIVELYIGDEDVADNMPLKQLKGFEKKYIAGNESEDIHMRLDRTSFARFDVSAKKIVTNSGKYIVYIGTNVSDIQYKFIVNIK